MSCSGKIAVLSLGAMLFFGTASLRGQTAPIVSRATLDSLAHPATAPGGEALHFESQRIDTGVLGEDDAPTTYTFRWCNQGRKPMIITRVETSCGCARASFSKAPVAPGSCAEIAVVYHPKGRPGYFQRKIFVYTQLSDKQPSAVLELSGRVTPSVLPTAAYPYVMGSLRLKQQAVRIAGTRIQTERIECLNAGEQPLTIRADSRLLPAYLRFECDPAVIEPGKTADLVIRFDPAKAPQTPPRQLPVVLDGLQLPPGQRSLRVLIGAQE